ncbi:MAG: DNA mismatch repair endonuclease MutL [Opitutales bacterium]
MGRMEVTARGRIQVLPDTVANQIAAGEVIERPAAVVKELVENSLDAGATRVRVRFVGAGKQLIEVEDDGCGMNPDDALLALERHATSKLRVASDLNAVRTLGFRGEALPSIASVSRFTLKTREADFAEGVEVRMNGGKLLDRRACGMPPGTRISVAHLFNSVPARRKFLRTDATEAAHIVQLLRLYAVAHPGVAFTLEEGSRVIFRSPACTRLADRVAEIWGRQLAETLIALSDGDEMADCAAGLRLRGLIGQPGRGRATRQELITLVNGRPVESRALYYAIVEAYEGLLPKGRYPAGFLFLEIGPERVDVNVHPAKREVRFREEGRVRAFVREALQTRLRELGSMANTATPVSERKTPESQPATTPADLPGGAQAAEAAAPFDTVGTARMRPPRPAYRPEPGGRGSGGSGDVRASEFSSAQSGCRQPTETSGADGESSSVSTDAACGSEAIAHWRWLGLLEGLPGCGLFETGQGLVLLDGVAAARRVRYERVLRALKATEVAGQGLLLGLPLEFSPLAAAAVEAHRAFLEGTGFVLEPFGRHFYRLQAAPAWLETEAAAETLVRDLVEQLRENRIGKTDTHDGQTRAREALAQLTVRRVQGPSTSEAYEHLTAQLMTCAQPLVDPAGKPTFTELGWRELAKRLGRG